MTTPPNASAHAGSEVPRGVSICIFREDSVVLVRRGKSPGYGRWAPIGGHVETGETDEAAVRRETAEETGLALGPLTTIGERTIHKDDGRIAIVLTVFAAHWIEGEPIAGDDAMEARFVALGDLAKLDLMDGVRPWIERAHAALAEPTRADGFER